jgi:hypothetical protein
MGRQKLNRRMCSARLALRSMAQTRIGADGDGVTHVDVTGVEVDGTYGWERTGILRSGRARE